MVDKDTLTIEIGDDVTRRKVVKALGAASALTSVSLSGCSGSNSSNVTSAGSQSGGTQGNSTQSGGDGGSSSNDAPNYQLVELVPPPTELSFNPPNDPDRKLAMLSYDASTDFFTPIIAGMHDATNKLGWNGTFTGPTEGPSVEKHVEMLESTIDSGPAAIITNVVDDEAYTDVLQRALNNDIPVYTTTTNAYSKKKMQSEFDRILPYVGQDLYASGYVAGLTLVDRLPDDASKATVGTIDPAQQGLQRRSEGIKSAVKQSRPDVEFTENVDYGANPNEAVNIVQDHMTANTNLDAMISTDALSWVIGQAAQNQGVADDVVVGGFDLASKTLDAIQSGDVNYTIGQDPYSQGFMSTMMMWAYLERGIPGKDYLTGSEVIDSENIDFAVSRSGEWSSLREWQRTN